MTHWNKASKSSLHTKIWQLYHCTTWLLANIQCPVYILSSFIGLYLKVSITTPQPPKSNTCIICYCTTHCKILDILHYIYPFIFKDLYWKEYMFLKTCFVSERLDTAFFFPKYLTEQIRRQADTVSLPCWICFQGSTLDSRTLPQPDTLAQWYRCPEWTSHSSDRICLPTKQCQNMSWVMYFYPCI